MSKVFITIRDGRKVVKKIAVTFEKVVDRLLDISDDALMPIQARAKLNNGETFKYKDQGYNVTLTPIFDEVY